MQNLILTGERARQAAIDMINSAPAGHIVKIGEPTRTDMQNKLLHPVLRVIVKAQPDRFASVEAAKLTFMDALIGELQMLPKLESNGFFPVGRKTSTLSVSQFNALMDLVFEYAGRHQIIIPDPRLEDAA